MNIKQKSQAGGDYIYCRINVVYPDYCETIWLVKNTRKGLVAPYEETIYYED